MIKSIELQKRTVEYTLRISRRARRMRLAVYPGGAFVVTVPDRLHQGLIEKFIIEKSRWIINKIEYFKKFPPKLFIKNKRQHYVEHKEEARALAHNLIERCNTFYNFKFNRVAIKNLKSRWGSCSRKGNLNFNYKIALIPKHLAAYIVVHELCHLAELNHSRKFWSLVAQTMPNHKALRRELKNI